MKKLICASFLLVTSSFALMQRATAAIVTQPFLPRPGDTVKVTIAGYCLYIERWEQVLNRVICYGVDAQAPIQNCIEKYQTSITNVTGPFTRIEVWGRAYGSQPPDGYSLRDIRGVKVDAVSTRRDPPTSLRVTSGIAQALTSEAARTSYGALLVQDAAGQPVEHARVSIDLVSLRGPTRRSYDQAIPRNTSSTGVAQFGATEAYYAAYQPGDYVTYTFTLTDTLSPKPAPAFAVVGIVSPQFAPYAFPVVEYQLTSRSRIDPPLGFAFFLASDAATMQSLDSLQTSFMRTYGAFTGLSANAPGAVPVCRFFSDGQKPVSAPVRYTQDRASINASLDSSGSATGQARWIDDGVAFCAPE